MPRRLLARLLVLLAAIAFALGGVEFVFRISGLDQTMFAKVMYYQKADEKIHEVSEDLILHYQMRPGASTKGQWSYGGYSSTVNAFGARGGAHHALEKAPGTFRILFFGGSTVYGASVNDDATIPAKLEVALDEAGDRDFEVWNYGHSAYVQAQMTRLAQLKLESIPEIDLILLMITNSGRRAFIEGTDTRPFFAGDPFLYPENFPVPRVEGLLPSRTERLHLFGLYYLSTYRYYAAWRLAQTRPQVRNKYTFGLSQRETIALEEKAEARGVPVVYANYASSAGGARSVPDLAPEERIVDLYIPGQESDFYEVHPGPEILEVHARNLADRLREKGLVP